MDPVHRTVEHRRFLFLTDPARRQHTEIVKAVFDSNECQYIIDAAKQFGWSERRHDAYPTVDVAVRDLPCQKDIQQCVHQRVISSMSEVYGFNADDLMPVDLFVVKYASNGQTQLKLHTDGCLLSFNVVLNTGFQGGGTYFDDDQRTVHLGLGDCVMHWSKRLHAGLPVTQGERYLLVGFIDTKGAASTLKSRSH